jgi:cobalt-zinc-cadmium efflux system protein
MNHSHSHPAMAAGPRLGIALLLTGAFVLLEAAAGLWANSLALLADAGHNLADALALGLSWYALRLARRPANARWTFGLHRAGILAALVNAGALTVIALVVFWKAIGRLRAPEPVQGRLVIAVALGAILLNGAISLWLHREAAQDLNVRSAYIHMVGDAISALGVAIAGAITWMTGWLLADPLVSFVIGGLILWSSWDVLLEAANVLLEAVPKGLDMVALKQGLREIPGVLGVHDLHVWTVASGLHACSCHIIVAEQSIRSGQQVLRAVAEVLRQRFGITHTTVQVEVDGCDPDDMYCTLRHAASEKPTGDHEPGPHHAY